MQMGKALKNSWRNSKKAARLPAAAQSCCNRSNVKEGRDRDDGPLFFLFFMEAPKELDPQFPELFVTERKIVFL